MSRTIWVLAVALTSCVGTISAPDKAGGGAAGGGGQMEDGGADGGTSVPPPVTFNCQPEAPASVTPLRRLSIRQYQNTLRDLFGGVPSFNPLVVAQDPLTRLPVDQVELSFNGMDARLSGSHVDGYYEVADALAAGVVGTPTVLTAVAGACATQTAPTVACKSAFLDGFATRAFRRPLTTEERTRYLALDDGSRDGKELFRSLMFSVLMSPQFLYLPEVDGSAVSQNVVSLSAYELASRLSYHFWQTMPDADLLASAESGALLTNAAEYERQLQRLVADPRTHATIAGFYAEWFELGRLTQFPTTPVFTAFAQGTNIGQSGADHLSAAAEEVATLADHFTWKVPGSLKDLLLTDVSFTKSSSLAGIYGVAPWDGVSTPVHLPAAQRSGILTRMAFLASGTHTTNPIHRGAIVRRRFLCEEMVAPAPASLPPGSLNPPEPNPEQTTRMRYTNKVKNEPCASCHRQMNPIGYVLEQYDALGRFRTDERVLDDRTGALLKVLPVDSVAVPFITVADAATITSGAELSRKVADSGKVEACFARQYFRFAYHRFDSSDDGCVLERVRKAAAASSLQGALIDLANDPSFRTRRAE